jgi:CRP-like cAMP-binding protein
MFGRRGGYEREVEKTFEDGEIIVHEDETTREMYVIQEGAVEVSKKSGDGEIILGKLERGDFFGEMALLESLPRSGTVRAIGRTRLLIIHAGGFLLKVRRDPTFAFEMLQKLSHRIRVLDEKLADAAHRLGETGEVLERVRREYNPVEDGGDDHAS